MCNAAPDLLQDCAGQSFELFMRLERERESKEEEEGEGTGGGGGACQCRLNDVFFALLFTGLSSVLPVASSKKLLLCGQPRVEEQEKKEIGWVGGGARRGTP